MRTVSLGLTLAVAVGMTLFLASIAWRERDRGAALLAASVGLCAAVGARDWIVLRLLHDYNAYTWARYVVGPAKFISQRRREAPDVQEQRVDSRTRRALTAAKASAKRLEQCPAGRWHAAANGC